MSPKDLLRRLLRLQEVLSRTVRKGDGRMQRSLRRRSFGLIQRACGQVWLALKMTWAEECIVSVGLDLRVLKPLHASSTTLPLHASSTTLPRSHAPRSHAPRSHAAALSRCRALTLLALPRSHAPRPRAATLSRRHALTPHTLALPSSRAPALSRSHASWAKQEQQADEQGRQVVKGGQGVAGDEQVDEERDGGD